MPYCPECRCEYRPEIKVCSSCQTDLVENLEMARPIMDDDHIIAYLQEHEIMPVAESTVDRLKPLRDVFLANGLPCLMIREECSSSCSSGCKGGPKLQLVVAAKDSELAHTLMTKEFLKLVTTETDDSGEAERLGRVVDVMGAGNLCPACDAPLPQGAAECPDCGLYVGVPEELLNEGDTE